MLPRALPCNLIMGEAVTFGQRFTYHSDHPIEVMLTEGYFLPVRSNINAGDFITLIRVESGRVREMQETVVVEVSANYIDIRTTQKRIVVPERITNDEDSGLTARTVHREFKVRRGFQCFVVENEENKQLAEFSTRAEAERYRDEMMGILKEQA